MATSNNGKTAQDLLDRVLLGKPDETKAKVLELVLRLDISPQDELFLIMIAFNHLQILIEDAPHDWQALFIEFQGELAEWSDINLETLNSLIRKAENEQILAETSKSLVNALINSTASWNKLAATWEKSPPTSTDSKLTSRIRELSEQLQNIQASQSQVMDRLMRLQHGMSRNLNTKVTLPAWVLFLMTALTISSFYNYTLLNSISERLAQR